MERFFLTLEDQENISIDELAKILFKILKLNLQEPKRRTGYSPGNLSSIKDLELCFDITAGRKKIHKDFEKKFAEAVKSLKDNGLIMEDPDQRSPEFVVLTTAGEKTSPEDLFPLISDSDKIIQNLENSIGKLDEIVKTYLKEAYETFKKNFLISSALSLGVMSERCILLFGEKIKDASQDPKVLEKYSDCRSIKAYGKFIKDNLEKLKKNYLGYENLWYEYDVKIDFLFQNYRLTRNEVGHPDNVPNIPPSDHELRLRTVPDYLKSIYKIINLL